jgi:hypothetical protein
MGQMKNIDVIKQERCATTLADDEKMVAEQYVKNGYKDREDYLSKMAEAYGLPLHYVKHAALWFGEVDDFDGLVSWLNDLPFNP